jgi:hypothetical protein
MREISEKTGVSISALHRHKDHMKRSLAKTEQNNGMSLREKFDSLVQDASDSLASATTSRDKMGWHGVLANWMNLAYKLGIEEARQREKQVYQDVTPAVLKMIEEAMG